MMAVELYILYYYAPSILTASHVHMLFWSSPYALADLGGVPGAHHPLWDPILLFLHTFSPKATALEVHTP